MEIKPTVYKPKKKVDEQGYDEEGILHDKCGTPDCCGGCETDNTQDIKKENGRI
jgi:hypothetical protein